MLESYFYKKIGKGICKSENQSSWFRQRLRKFNLPKITASESKLLGLYYEPGYQISNGVIALCFTVVFLYSSTKADKDLPDR